MIQQPMPGPVTLTLIQQPNGCAAWRVCWPAYALSALGYPVAWGYNGVESHASQIQLAQLVVLHRSSWKVGDEWKALLWREMLHENGKALGYETDDDLYSPEILERVRKTGDAELNARSDEQLERERQARIYALGLADGVTVSTEALAAVVRQYTDKPVLVVPNAIDLERFRVAIANYSRRTADSPLTIGWAGGNRPDRDAEQLGIAWGRIARRFPHVRFLVGGYPLGALLNAVPTERCVYVDKTSIGQYPATFAEVDIGCCPLADEVFNRSKSPIKAMEYAAAGAAVLASPTVYDGFLTHGVDGYICRTADEWEHYLALLIEHPGKRELVASRLLQRVEAEHSLNATVHRWPEAWTAITRIYLGRREALSALFTPGDERSAPANACAEPSLTRTAEHPTATLAEARRTDGTSAG